LAWSVEKIWFFIGQRMRVGCESIFLNEHQFTKTSRQQGLILPISFGSIYGTATVPPLPAFEAA
jgi:hypothetical protein